MNGIIEFFQGLASHVPDLLQPVIIAMAGAVPFIEGEVSSVIGVWAGLNPVIAGLAGAIGNFICVTVIVLLGARARKAVVTRREAKRNATEAAAVPAIVASGSAVASTDAEAVPGSTLNGTDLDRSGIEGSRFEDSAIDGRVDHLGDVDVDARPRRGDKPESKGRIKFKRFLTRFGVPGASLLGPLAIPTQITSTILVSAGVKTSWILLWQGIAIAAWTTLTTLIATGALAFFAG